MSGTKAIIRGPGSGLGIQIGLGASNTILRNVQIEDFDTGVQLVGAFNVTISSNVINASVQFFGGFTTTFGGTSPGWRTRSPRPQHDSHPVIRPK